MRRYKEYKGRWGDGGRKKVRVPGDALPEMSHGEEEKVGERKGGADEGKGGMKEKKGDARKVGVQMSRKGKETGLD